MQCRSTTYDPYGFIREAWVQQRRFAIYDGNPPPERWRRAGGTTSDDAKP